ncbi:MAG TPA: transposase [Candidatus Paceibacterota bacterium]
MGTRSVTFAPEEWFHCYTRGVDRRTIFLEERDYARFHMLLFSCNGTKPIHISNLNKRAGPMLETVFQQDRGAPLVDIGAYALMPSHPHLLLRERDYGGISAFMQKLGTAYTMYFNKKYERSGSLFSSRFKARHVNSDVYFRKVVNYIHANPAEIVESKWKEGVIRNEKRLKNFLLTYRFSSLPDYEGSSRLESAIINRDGLLDVLDTIPTFAALLKDARVFYRQESEEMEA